jgi:pimeloyl-ACP methyl ester carboxylesterase
MKLIVDGLAVNYQMDGIGKTVLLLHGWGDDHTTFNDLIAELKKDFRVLALDLPGFGASESPKLAWNLDNYAIFLNHFLNKLAVRTYAVVGHSNGGALAVRALANGRIKATKLVLIAASGIRNTNSARRFVIKLGAKIAKAATIWLPRSQRQKLRKKLYTTIGSDLLLKPELQETFKRTVRQDVQADAAKLNLPTLLIFGAQDSAIPLSDAKRYHELIKGSVLEIINTNDHFIHHAEASKVNRLIKDFLR